MADVAAEICVLPVDFADPGISGIARVTDRGAESDDAQHPAAARYDVVAIDPGTGVKNLAVFVVTAVQTADRCAARVSTGIAAGGHHDAERRARIPAAPGSAASPGRRAGS